MWGGGPSAATVSAGKGGEIHMVLVEEVHTHAYVHKICMKQMNRKIERSSHVCTCDLCVIMLVFVYFRVPVWVCNFFLHFGFFGGCLPFHTFQHNAKLSQFPLVSQIIMETVCGS